MSNQHSNQRDKSESRIRWYVENGQLFWRPTFFGMMEATERLLDDLAAIGIHNIEELHERMQRIASDRPHGA